MITAQEIRNKTNKKYISFLQSLVEQRPFEKLVIRGDKSYTKSSLPEFEKEIQQIVSRSKEKKGFGYTLKFQLVKTKFLASQNIPISIYFDTEKDFLKFLDKEKETELFKSDVEKITNLFPKLKEWIIKNPLRVITNQTEWDNVLKVCQYFMETPRPNLYLRQLPIEIHTKFIEENNALIQSLLDFLIPDHVRSTQQKRFAERFFLRYDEPLIRLRFLDENPHPDFKFRDISIPLSDFEALELPAENILIAENKMNFLTLPLLRFTVAIWSGGGFNISYIKNATWLSDKKIWYWGDIDEHGFQILHQLRSYYPHTKSVLMNRETFENFQNYTIKGARNKVQILNLLTKEENDLFQHLKSIDKNRLEQEKITQAYADEYLKNLFEQ
ncbi:Wadjet anti-phage system protein JetD domain-containing protein [Chryseobacterium hagamense]|uniref:Wadjet protein JetD C-terminal domain-containing protein n=1 Tax=Chryseobacterium hagamense TaxID=395935 RepID=A0A511YGG1_9FLAO|nr:Wadjet anti-phage system protein JetD domain-containing protein [Chryseobacterium hagamense]GEN74300.1 hypothetical protein CHA01nite_00400 [Chryseobacterium hagamense]